MEMLRLLKMELECILQPPEMMLKSNKKSHRSWAGAMAVGTGATSRAAHSVVIGRKADKAPTSSQGRFLPIALKRRPILLCCEVRFSPTLC